MDGRIAGAEVDFHAHGPDLGRQHAVDNRFPWHRHFWIDSYRSSLANPKQLVGRLAGYQSGMPLSAVE
jgi:hypothetical protein